MHRTSGLGTSRSTSNRNAHQCSNPPAFFCVSLCAFLWPILLTASLRSMKRQAGTPAATQSPSGLSEPAADARLDVRRELERPLRPVLDVLVVVERARIENVDHVAEYAQVP